MDARILIVEDEPVVAEVLTTYLEREGCTVATERDGERGLTRARSDPFDAVILDLLLPSMDGLDVCRRLRRESDVPVLMLTARGEPEDRILGFGVGADDYVVKPFNAVEVVLRLKAILRRGRASLDAPAGTPGSAPATPDRVEFGPLVVDRAGRRVWLKGREVALTAREFDLLAFLVAHPGVVFSRGQLISRVWGYEYEGDTGTVSVHVRRLREKLGEDPSAPAMIRTVWGVGYRFDPPDSPASPTAPPPDDGSRSRPRLPASRAPGRPAREESTS